jgi:hypothetical protein
MAQPTISAANQSRRRTERVLLRIPIEISGQDVKEKSFKEKTHTLVINRDGARVALHASVRAGTLVNVKNLQTALAARFRIVGPSTRSLGETPEWGVECLEHGLDFWGISFPEKGGTLPRPESVDALVQCAGCQAQEMAQLTLEQYRGASQGAVRRPCAQCGKVTEWRFGPKEARKGTAAPAKPASRGAPSKSERGEERRADKRLTVRVPVRVRLPDGSEEVTKSENLSKTGVCFSASLKMKTSDRIFVTVGYSPDGSGSEFAAEVLWKRELDEAGRALYGVHLKQS